MPATRKDSAAPSSSNQSNKSITAETAPETVMAEQIGHNVVDNTESTSALALVDDAANQTTIVPAERGTVIETLPQTKTEDLQATLTANQHASDTNAVTSSPNSGADAVDAAVEPSAGEAAATTAAVRARIEPTEPEAAPAETAPLLNSGDDAAILADGVGEDGTAPEGSIDVSLNSDTEGSRGDVSEQKKDDEKHHTRTNSVKKPTTFSKVSVTKNFLAKSATTTPTPAKAGEKPSGSGTPPALAAPTARPRLIAKLGASVRDGPKTRLGSDSSSGPDASKVWNKNRPVAPPPPKQFTDEELKQQYGIHLATRLQTDENGKDAKWADIDDEEDDWAPDTVVWMDGTKSSLTAQETATPIKEDKPSSPQPQKLAEGVRPTLMTKRTTELGPTKTILKPGASAAAAQAKQNGASGTPTDRESQSASPAPSKSPWAPLPPVEKVSPVNPPVQQQSVQPTAPRFATQDARAYEPQPPPQPTREIPADTFDRSWRENEGAPRELFNSANGRYEVVTEGRRGSIKPDSSFRKPSLLQRSSQSVNAPAEPSAAFQTRTTNQMDGAWARRRGSSVSQGSIPPGIRRVSMSKGSDMSPASERRTSTVIGHDMRASPKMARNEPAQPVFAQQSTWQQQMPARPESGAEAEAEETVAEDPVKVQERIMREKRELAKKRRQEAEEREELEKQERLKARLAQLEGAGKSRKEREAEAAAAAAAAANNSTSPGVQASEVTPSTVNAEEPLAPPSQTAEMAAMVAPASEAQSQPSAYADSIPEQPSPDEKLPSPLPQKPHFTGLPERPISSTDQNQRQPPRTHLSPRANPRVPLQSQSSPYGQPAASYQSPGDRKPQAFGRSPMPSNDAFSTPWPTTAPNGNVWGTSGIGNGTFESAGSFAPMHQISGLPPPPGMTRQSGSARISPQSFAPDSRSPNLQQQTVAESNRGFAPPGFESRPDPFANQGRVNGASPVPGLARQPYAPGPIAPPSRTQPQGNQHEDKLRAWNRAAESLPEQYRSDVQAASTRPAPAAPSAPREDTIKETFKKTSVSQGRLGAPRRYEEAEYTIHDGQGSRSVQSLSPVPPYTQTQPSGATSTASPLQHDTWMQAGERTVRIPDGSLNAAHGGTPVQQPPIGPPSAPPQQRAVSSPLPLIDSTMDQSPPPPESSSHPVNSGNIGHPLVKLPPGKPIVKLPPAPATSPSQPPLTPQQAVMMPQRPISNLGAPGSSRPIVMQQAWQERFNGLFNRAPIQTEVPPSPPKTPPKVQSPALAVAVSSRTVMDELPAASAATVSLPQMTPTGSTSAEGFTVDDSQEVTSKSQIEQTFMEELSFGSKPRIAMPRDKFYSEAIHNDRAPRSMLSMGTVYKFTVHANTLSEVNLRDIHPKHREGYFVNLPALKIRNRLVRRRVEERKASGAPNQERKPSGKFIKPKGKEAVPPLPGSTPSQSNNSSKSESTTEHGSPAPASSPVADSRSKSSMYPKPRRGGGSRRSHTQPQSVRAAQ